MSFRALRNKTILLGLFLLGSFPVHAQSTSTRGTRPDPIQKELQRRFESEAIERALSENPRHRAESDWRTTLLQIKLDFLRIQIINDEIQKLNPATASLEHNLISKSAAEIARCAQRLKINLALPAGYPAENPQRKNDLNAEELRLSLAALSSAINSFVANPVFEKAGVVDVKLSLQASRDLEQIIQVSKQMKRTSEKLRRLKAA